MEELLEKMKDEKESKDVEEENKEEDMRKIKRKM